MAARPDGLSVGADRRKESAAGRRWRTGTLPLALAGLAPLSGCQNPRTRQSIESDRFLDEYASGRGLTKEQARNEVMAKLEDRDERQVMNSVEDKGVDRRVR